MPTRRPDQIPDLAGYNKGGKETTAERNNGGTEPIVDITSEAQADRPQSKLRELLEGTEKPNCYAFQTSSRKTKKFYKSNKKK